MKLTTTFIQENYKQIEVLKQSSRSLTELVIGPDRELYVRKCFEQPNYPYAELLQLNSPWIAKVFHASVEDNRIYLIEEFVQGSNLYDLLQEKGSLSEKYIEQLAWSLSSALKELHDAGLIHRDVKLENIMVAKEGQLKIVDLDTVRRASDPEQKHDTVIMGTEGYAPPEQFGFMVTDQRSDIYAYGKTIMRLYRQEQPSQAMQEFLNKCTRFDPQERFANIQELQAALTNLAALKKLKPKPAETDFLTKLVKSALDGAFKVLVWSFLAIAAFLFFFSSSEPKEELDQAGQAQSDKGASTLYKLFGDEKQESKEQSAFRETLKETKNAAVPEFAPEGAHNSALEVMGRPKQNFYWSGAKQFPLAIEPFQDMVFPEVIFMNDIDKVQGLKYTINLKNMDFILDAPAENYFKKQDERVRLIGPNEYGRYTGIEVEGIVLKPKEPRLAGFLAEHGSFFVHNEYPSYTIDYTWSNGDTGRIFLTEIRLYEKKK